MVRRYRKTGQSVPRQRKSLWALFKKKGGRVYAAITQDGEVTFHEDWLTEKEARQQTKGSEDGADEPITQNAQGYFARRRSLADIFQSLLTMEDETVLRVLSFVMAETLEAHTDMVDTLGGLIGTDMRNWWTPDGTFFDFLRDKAAINGMVREIAGGHAADAHTVSTAKVQRQIVNDCLSDQRRPEVKNWFPVIWRFQPAAVPSGIDPEQKTRRHSGRSGGVFRALS